MAKTLSKAGISTTSTIEAGHVSQSIDAFTGIDAYDITISGSLTINGPTSGSFTGSFSGSIDGTITSASFATSASYATTASYALTANTASYSLNNFQEVLDNGSSATISEVFDLTVNENITINSPADTATLTGDEAKLSGSNNTTIVGNSVNITGKTNLVGAFTASGDISSSGTIFANTASINYITAAGSNGEIQFNKNGGIGSNSAFIYVDGPGDFLVGDGFGNNTISSSVFSVRLTLGDTNDALTGHKIDIINQGTIDGKTPGIYLEGPVDLSGAFTASGDISSSGILHSTQYKVDGVTFIDTGGGSIFLGSASTPTLTRGNYTFINPITASSDISSSGVISASAFSGDGSGLTNIPAGTVFPFTGSAIITGSLIVTGSYNSSINNSKICEVATENDLPSTLEANTSYLIRGNVEIGRTLNINNQGVAVLGIDRNESTLSYTGSSALFNVTDQNFTLKNITLKSSGSIISGSNITPGNSNFNYGRTKVLDIKDCQIKNTNDVMTIVGFELVDINNTLFWYITGSHGLEFQSVRHLEISSCEMYNWYNENDTGSFAPSGTRMIEILPNTGSVNSPVVNISSCILHPEQGQIGLYIDSGSSTLFGTVAANTFIDVNGGVLLDGSTYDSSSMLKYDVGLNQGLEDSNAHSMGYFTGLVSTLAPASFTLLDVNGAFSSSNSQRMSISSSGEITYNGSKPIYVEMDANITFVAGGANADATCAFFKSGSGGNNQLSGSSGRIKIRNSADVQTLPLHYSTTLNQNDKIGVYLRVDAQNMDLENITISIKE